MKASVLKHCHETNSPDLLALRMEWDDPALLLPNTKGKFVDGSVIEQITETFENRTYNVFFLLSLFWSLMMWKI